MRSDADACPVAAAPQAFAHGFDVRVVVRRRGQLRVREQRDMDFELACGRHAAAQPAHGAQGPPARGRGDEGAPEPQRHFEPAGGDAQGMNRVVVRLAAATGRRGQVRAEAGQQPNDGGRGSNRRRGAQPLTGTGDVRGSVSRRVTLAQRSSEIASTDRVASSVWNEYSRASPSSWVMTRRWYWVKDS